MLVLANGCWKPGELQHESHGCAEPDRVMTNIDMTEAGIQRDGQKDVTGTGTVTGTEKNRRHVKIFEVPNCKSCSVDRSNMAQPCCPCSEFPCPRRGTIVDVVLRQTATPSQAHSDGFQAIRELRCISGRPGRPH